MTSIQKQTVQDKPMENGENAEDESTDEDDEDIEDLLDFSMFSSEDDDDDDDDETVDNAEPLASRDIEVMPPLAPYEPSSDTELDPADSDQEIDARITERFLNESMAFVDVVTKKSDLAD